MLVSSDNPSVPQAPDGHLIDLEAMEAGQFRNIELREEFDNSSLLLGKSVYLKYEKTIVAVLLHSSTS